MNETVSQLLDTALKRPLTAAEEAQWAACLAANPAGRAEMEDAMSASQLVHQVVPAPMASNFTTQVLLALDRDAASSSTPPRDAWLARLLSLRWARPAAFAALVLGAGLLTWQQYRHHTRVELANSLRLPTLMQLPSVDMLKDFDAIISLRQTPRSGADVELLNALELERLK